ncbi:Secreted protein OS=Streptomyces alboniger OX=132473 GN=CP975_17250 PE=4 SV=1 [Streptomyces alboniger]
MRADAKIPSAESAGSPRLLGLGLATAARCGPELTSPDGVEAQTCVLTQGEENWARTYYRNVTGEALHAVLSVMGPGGRTVQMRCAVAAEDDPGMCETPRERTRGDLDGYTAVAEFAAKGGHGPLLLRSGSNSGTPTGS